MNYEKLIVELFSRIQVLEEQVAELMSQNTIEKKGADRMKTREIESHIERVKDAARKDGQTSIVLRSGDIHKELNLKHYMPSVCNAMRHCMGPMDVVLHTTPSGNSSTIEIEYFL